MIVKIDVDGVIRDIISAMCELYNERFCGNLTVDDIDDYDVNLNFSEIKKQLGKKPTEYFFTDNGDLIFETLSKPFNGVKEAIGKLREQGHKVIIVTWQFSLKNIKHTLDFLEMHSIKYDDICFTKDKWIVKGDYLIDDNPEFILDDRDTSEKIIIDTPYNKYVSNDFNRCVSLSDAVEYIINKEDKSKNYAKRV